MQINCFKYWEELKIIKYSIEYEKIGNPFESSQNFFKQEIGKLLLI